MGMIKNLRQRHRLLFNLTVMAAIIAVMALSAHLLMQIGTRHGSRRTVPDFSGMPLKDAIREARDRDLEIKINDSLYVPAYQGGIVLDQLPESGVEVKPGRKVYITINSFRQKMVPVPYVAGRSLRQAKNMLEIAGLEIKELVYRPDMATNYVLEQHLNGSKLDYNSKVETEMGNGITLVVGVKSSERYTVVPQVVGMSLRAAKSRLWESGMNVGEVKFDEGINLLNQKDARVYVQSPAAERGVALGAKVSLQLTLDGDKSAKNQAEAVKQAGRELAAREREREKADTLAKTAPAAEAAPAAEESAEKENESDFFE